MLNFWFGLTMLAFESHEVIGLRLTKLAGGGAAALDEADLMIREKIHAGFEAITSMAMGASPPSVVSRYREVVQANYKRLGSEAAA